MNPRPTFSVEFFPPKDELGEQRLWKALTELESFEPDFVSVTYGAGGSTRDRTIRLTAEITARSGIPTIAHLTCVGSTKAELVKVLSQYQAAGIKSVLALRGDPVGGPCSNWITTPGGFDHADQLVSLAIEHGFEVGVAAFPDGHPASQGNLDKDLAVLLEKERRGATFATTQFFFESKKYFALKDKLLAANSKLTLYPGVLPITNLTQLRRMTELSGTPIPSEVERKFSDCHNDPSQIREIGVQIAIELCDELLSGGVPGIHFYTMNSATSTIEVIKGIGLR